MVLEISIKKPSPWSEKPLESLSSALQDKMASLGEAIADREEQQFSKIKLKLIKSETAKANMLKMLAKSNELKSISNDDSF